MEKLIAFISSVITWYGIISFIAWELDISEWHWVAKLVYLIFTFLTYQRIIEKRQIHIYVYMYERVKCGVWYGIK